MHIKNTGITDTANDVKLHILASGYAKLDSSWGNTVKNTLCSRLYYILDGEFYVISETGEETLMQAGNVYLIPSGYTYRYGCHHTVEQTYYHFQLSACDRIDLLRSCHRILSFPMENPDPIYHKKLTLAKGMTAAVQIQSEVYTSLYRFICQCGLTFEAPRYSDIICDVLNYIDNNLSVQLNLKEISAAVHLAPSTLSRKFRKETGTSIGEYIDEQIMFAAEQKLAAGEISIAQISDQYGFCDQFYFSRKFKEKYGVSPSSYRQNPPL